MAISYPIFDFPTTAIEGQLFYAGGAALEGGFTSGGARVITPEPGGRAFLELQLSLQTREWERPFVSWLISKIANGAIFRVPLVKTPQLVSDASFTANGSGQPWNNGKPWDNSKNWKSEIVASVTSISLQGSQNLSIDLFEHGQVLFHGHVIGINDHSYMIDDIEYNDNGTANVILNPPLREEVGAGMFVLFRPLFLGSVINASEFRTTYEKSNEGHIRPGRLLFAESLI